MGPYCPFALLPFPFGGCVPPGDVGTPVGGLCWTPFGPPGAARSSGAGPAGNCVPAAGVVIGAPTVVGGGGVKVPFASPSRVLASRSAGRSLIFAFWLRCSTRI